MNKTEKKILQTGEDAFGTKYYYYCKRCKTMNALNVPRCENCGEKRPRKALEYAHTVAPRQSVEYGHDVDRTARNCGPEPVQPCFAVPMPNNGNYDPAEYARNSRLNLPTYYMTDEYGRVYRAKVHYGAQPCSAPVPVPIPSKVVQTTPIVTPINIQK